jgi:hypothetical protein
VRHHASPHELAYGVTHIRVIPTEPIGPTDHEHIAGPLDLQRSLVRNTVSRCPMRGLPNLSDLTSLLQLINTSSPKCRVMKAL